jgi:type IV fimbrial biogenesis protein FimT
MLTSTRQDDAKPPPAGRAPLTTAASSRGFTIVELMVSIAVLGVLVVMGAPSMRGVLENSRIRTAGESMKYGLALARSEAVRLNTPVEFVNQAAGWQVLRVIDGTQLHAASGKESTRELELTVTPAGATRVTYDSFGRVFAANPSDDSDPIVEMAIASLRPPTTSDYRPLRLQVQRGGSTRLCDPAVDSADPRACL